MSTQESEDLEEPKPWIISNAYRIFGVIGVIMSTVKLGLTENLSFLRFYENQPGENEPVYWILVFGMLLELAAIIRLFYLVIRINRRFRHLSDASSLPNLVPEISNPELRSIEASPDTTLIAESDEDKLSETRNELPDKIEELQNGNEFEILSEPKQENVVELQPKIIESTQSFHDISEEIVSKITE